MSDLDKAIKEILMERFDSVYCDTCKGNEDDTCCDDCHRKTMMWSVSENIAENIAKQIKREVERID
jgi:hypothetical protein